MELFKELSDDVFPDAISELKSGQKLGHWIWWVFPTGKYGLDIIAPCITKSINLHDLAEHFITLDDCRNYIRMPILRNRYLEILRASNNALSKYSKYAPYEVFDSAFDRKHVGEFLCGPIDSFKVRISVTLFAHIATKISDNVLKCACNDVLKHFIGDCIYIDNITKKRNILNGHDTHVIESFNI
jgi:uncharacterized protein (DUF1810 family)